MWHTMINIISEVRRGDGLPPDDDQKLNLSKNFTHINIKSYSLIPSIFLINNPKLLWTEHVARVLFNPFTVRFVKLFQLLHPFVTRNHEEISPHPHLGSKGLRRYLQTAIQPCAYIHVTLLLLLPEFAWRFIKINSNQPFVSRFFRFTILVARPKRCCRVTPFSLLSMAVCPYLGPISGTEFGTHFLGPKAIRFLK